MPGAVRREVFQAQRAAVNAATCLPSVSGDSTRCHATAQCGGSNVDLSCYETGSNVACNCSVDGKVLWKSATNLDFAKSACLDADLFRLCAKQLQ